MPCGGSSLRERSICHSLSSIICSSATTKGQHVCHMGDYSLHFSMRARRNLGRTISFTLIPKTLDHNGVFYKLTLKENEKSKITQALSSRAQLEIHEVKDEFAYDNPKE